MIKAIMNGNIIKKINVINTTLLMLILVILGLTVSIHKTFGQSTMTVSGIPTGSIIKKADTQTDCPVINDKTIAASESIAKKAEEKAEKLFNEYNVLKARIDKGELKGAGNLNALKQKAKSASIADLDAKYLRGLADKMVGLSGASDEQRAELAVIACQEKWRQKASAVCANNKAVNSELKKQEEIRCPDGTPRECTVNPDPPPAPDPEDSKIQCKKGVTCGGEVSCSVVCTCGEVMKSVGSGDDNLRKAVYYGNKDVSFYVKRPVEDACFVLSGAGVSVAKVPKNFSVSIDNGEIKICSSKLNIGKYLFTFGFDADTSAPQVSARVEANYSGTLIKGNIPIGPIFLSPSVSGSAGIPERVTVGGQLPTNPPSWYPTTGISGQMPNPDPSIFDNIRDTFTNFGRSLGF